VTSVYNASEDRHNRSQALRSFAQRREVHDKNGYTGYRHGRSKNFKQEIIAVVEDDPDSTESAIYNYLEEVRAGLDANRPPGTFEIPANVVVTVIDVEAGTEPELLAAVKLLKGHTTLAMDAEWNTSTVTGNGHTSPPLLLQICAAPAHRVGQGELVTPQTMSDINKCSSDAELAKLHAKLLAQGHGHVPPDLAMCHEPTTVVLFRLHTVGSSAKAISQLPTAIVELLNNKDILWLGANHQNDFTLLNKYWSPVHKSDGRKMCDVGHFSFHGRSDADFNPPTDTDVTAPTTAPTASDLGQVESDEEADEEDEEDDNLSSTTPTRQRLIQRPPVPPRPLAQLNLLVLQVRPRRSGSERPIRIKSGDHLLQWPRPSSACACTRLKGAPLTTGPTPKSCSNGVTTLL
jgi:hypothetical protein